ncbi:MAG: carboxy terminal-processing peptidase, partial [Sediminibacterium sp.]
MVKRSRLSNNNSFQSHFALFLNFFMRVIMTYIKQNKWSFLAIVLVFGGLFFAFNIKTDQQEPSAVRHRKLVSTIGQLLETEHYSPRKIDDAFSKEVFDGYLKALDPDKTLFLQSDIDSLRIYERRIDDEIHGSPLIFTDAVDFIYERRIKEAKALFNQLIESSFDFNTNDSIYFDADQISYAKNSKERDDRWRKLLTYKVLDRYVTATEEREKNKGKEKYVVKSDSLIEVESRNAVKKIQVKKFESLERTFGKEKRFETFLNTITGLMDPHTDYFAPVEKRSFTEQMSGVFYGIGALLGQDDNGVKLVNITPGGPAWKSGQLVANDVIIKVAQGAEEPVDIEGYETTDAVKLIRGSEGTEVRLTIRKPDGTIKVVSLIREKVVLDEGYARSAVITKGNDKYGYIFLPDFYADFEREDGHRCSEDVAKEIVKLKAENVKGITIDVRFNGGGSLYEVVQMVGLFIDKGPVVQIRDKGGRSQVLYDETPGTLYDGPLVVMVNEFSASASEIFAAAIQDYKRGIIVGSSSSYGKGTVQRNVSFGKPLDSLGIQTEYGAVKLTIQKFYRINGSSTQKRGVAPDIILPDEYEFFKYREKDNPNALAWDEMEKAKYQVWTKSPSIYSIATAENKKINADTAMTRFKKNAQSIAGQIERPSYLNINKFKAFKKQIQDIVQQNENILKLKEPMQVAPLKADH